MKLTNFLVTSAAGLALTLVACKSKSQAEAAPAGTSDSSTVTSSSEMETIALEVKGMTWGAGCVKKVQAALTKVNGVSDAKVAMPGSATVTGSASADDLIAAVNSIPGGRYSASAK